MLLNPQNPLVSHRTVIIVSLRMLGIVSSFLTPSFNSSSESIDPEEANQKIQQFYGNALVYRAMSYMDLMRMYEYKRTGIGVLDSEAESRDIYGLTTVIIDENFDNANAENNPRVPFYHMYRFIMDDLNKAEKYLDGYTRNSKIRADISVVQSLKARLWLEINLLSISFRWASSIRCGATIIFK